MTHYESKTSRSSHRPHQAKHDDDHPLTAEGRPCAVVAVRLIAAASWVFGLGGSWRSYPRGWRRGVSSEWQAPQPHANPARIAGRRWINICVPKMLLIQHCRTVTSNSGVITTTPAPARLDDLTDDAWHVIGTSARSRASGAYCLPEFEVWQMREQRNHLEIETVQRLDSVGCFSLLAKLAKPAVRRFR